MAAGIVDHETGTRDIRRLNGLLRAMPITGTLALVASAAMAGVPLLNGFLSKEMFFAETVFIVVASRGSRSALPVVATRRRRLRGRLLAALRLRHLLRPAVDRPAARAARAAALDARADRAAGARLPASSASSRRGRSGPSLAAAARPVVGGALPEYSLAVWHGFNAPLVMSLRRASPAASLGYLLAAQAHRARPTPATRRSIAAPRRQARCSRARSSRSTRARAHASLRARRHAAPAAADVRDHRRSRSCSRCARRAAACRSRGATGRACRRRRRSCCCGHRHARARVGAAWQAKFHRLAALTMLGGAGLVTCLTFVWFSAPDLALTQLVVEVVTTMLFLLGLRWLPKRVEADEPRVTLRARLRRGARPAARGRAPAAASRRSPTRC